MTQLGLQPGLPQGQMEKTVSLAEGSRLDPILCLVDQDQLWVSYECSKHLPKVATLLLPLEKSDRRPSSFRPSAPLSCSVQTISTPPSQSGLGLVGPAGFVTTLDCKVCPVDGTTDRSVWLCPRSQQRLQCDVCDGACGHTGAGGTWKHGTQALGWLRSYPIQVEHDPGPWKPCVVIFQAASLLDGTHGAPLPSPAHSCLLLSAQDTCAHTKVWPAS